MLDNDQRGNEIRERNMNPADKIPNWVFYFIFIGLLMLAVSDFVN